MTIASEITRINTNIANAYTACNSKGATMPATQNSANLATCINSISGGAGNLQSKTLEVSSATPTISVISPDSGYDGLSSVTVDMTYIEDRLDTVLGSSVVPTGIGITREVSANGVYQMPIQSFTFSLPSNATDVGAYAMYYAFFYCTSLTSVDLSNLTTVSGISAMNSAFYGCTGLTSVDLSSLTTVSGSSAMGNAFRGCTGLTSVDLSSLTTVSGSSAMGSAFNGCTGLTSVDLSSLTTVSGSSAMVNAFNGCTGLTSVDLSSLTTVSGSSAMGSAFRGCTKLTTLSFPALTSTSFGSYSNQFNDMLYGVTGCTVHFPSNLQSVIGSWSLVTSGFGGTNTTVLFDLPATT